MTEEWGSEDTQAEDVAPLIHVPMITDTQQTQVSAPQQRITALCFVLNLLCFISVRRVSCYLCDEPPPVLH